MRTRKPLEVVRSPYTGYCFGVKRAMKLIDDETGAAGSRIRTMGEVIHNRQAVERLERRGISHVSSLDELEEGDTLVLRAHGVHPELVEEARARGIKIVDATCPFVQKSHNHVRRMTAEGYRVIIIGDGDHPEVKSIAGCAGDDAIIVGSVEEAGALGRMERAGVVIQTTLEREDAMRVVEVLREKVGDLRVHDTICHATELRRKATLDLAESVDVMLVVGGRGSSNTKRLYRMCRDTGVPTLFIETADELDPGWFEGLERIGLTTGTSTPDWVIEEVLRRLEEISRTRTGAG